jgi:PAS domain S-box-containing protein
LTAFVSGRIRHRPYVARLAIVCAAYFGTAKLGLGLAFDNASVTAIWPPSGIALAATLIWGYRIWPGIAAGALLANTWTGVPPITVLGITCGNTLEAMAGAYLLHRVDFRISLARVRDVFALFALAALVSTMVSATIGVASLYVGDHVTVEAIPSTWRTWWLGDMGGDLLIAPLLLVAAAPLRFREFARRRFEVACLLAALVGTSLSVFAIDMPIKYMLFPPMLWAALRFRQVGAVMSSLVVISIGVVFTAAGAGPFTQTSIDGALLLTQTFIGVAAVTCLLLAAISSEQKLAEEKLRRAHEGLEEIVRERTAELERSNTELALQAEIAANMAEGVMVISPMGTIAYANSTFETMFGYGPGELDDRPVSVLNGPNVLSPEATAAEILSVLERDGGFSGEIRNLKKDGTFFWTHAEVSTFDRPEIGGKVWVSVQRDITDQKRGEAADARLRAIVEQAGDAILGSTTDGIVTSWNPGAERLYGYTADEMIGRSIDCIIPDHRSDDVNNVLSSVRNGEAFRTEAERRRRDGSLVWVSITVSPVKDRNGFIVGCSGIHSDVTERRRAAQELAKRESQLSDAQRVAHIGSWEWNIAANTISWSDELYRIHGFELDEFDASFEAFMECIHPDDRELVDGIIKKAFRDGEPFEYYHRCVRPNGEVRALHAHGHVELGEDGRPVRMFGTCQDVTEMKRMEEPLRHLAAIVESSEDAILSKSRKTVITSWNPGAARLFGYDTEDVIGRPVSVLIPESRRGEEQDIFESVFSGTGVVNYETQRRRKDGTLVDVSVTVSPIKDGQGTIIGCSSITRDVTERKRIQEEADRLKDEFFATVSHELRTPLTSIIGYTDLLLAGDAGKLTEQQRRFLEITERNAKRQLRLVGDMLFVSKAEAGEFKIELGRADIDAVVSGCVEAARPAAERRGIELRYSGARTSECDADGDRIAQLADNLISNAIKFTPEGGKVVVDLSVNGGQIVLEVANTGSYILPQDRERLFERFYRASSAGEEAVQGVGLGLTIAEAIVRAHGGTIEVESDVQAGTVFRAHLPVHEPLDASSLSLPERNGSASMATRA